MIRIRFCGPRELIQRYFSGAQYVQSFKSQEIFVKGKYKFPCANGTLCIPNFPRPSSTVVGVRGRFLSSEKVQQDQLIFDWSANGLQTLIWHPVLKNLNTQDSFDRHDLEFNSVFNDFQKNHEGYSSRFQEKDQFLGGDSIQKQMSNAFGPGKLCFNYSHSSTPITLNGTRGTWVTCLMSSCKTTISRCSIRLRKKHYEPLEEIRMNTSWRLCLSDKWESPNSWSMR